MSLPATHFHGLMLRFLSVPMMSSGNNLQDSTLHPDGGILSLYVRNRLNK
jgi:hypothetical protein